MNALNLNSSSDRTNSWRERLRARFRTQLWPLLAILALMVVETTEVSLWYQAVFEPQGSSWARIFAILFLVSVLSYLLARGLDALRWRMLLRQAAFVVWILLAAFITLKLLLYAAVRLSVGQLVGQPVGFIINGNGSEASFFHLVGMLLLIWRGVALARNPITISRSQGSFQFGLVVLLIYGMIYAPIYPMEAMVGLYLFLFAGLIGMSMARIANLSELRGGRVPRFGSGWMISILIAGLLVVGLALLTGWLSSGRVMEVIAQAVVIIFAILTALVLIILSPFLMYLEKILPLLAGLIDQLLERLRNIPYIEQMAKVIEAINDGLNKVMPYLLAGRGLFLLLILLLLMAGVLLALYLRNIRRQLVEEEESETAEPGTTPNMLQKLLNRLLGGGRGLRLVRPDQILAAARIRQIYRSLMALSQKLGAARPASATPLEFLPQLEGLFPEEQAGLGLITGAYVKIRYGAYPETREEVEEVVEAWNRVRKQGRRALAVRRQKKSRTK